jgi:hypothetical protein
MSGLRYPRQDISGFNPADYLEMAEFEALLMETMDVDCDLFEKYSTTIATLQMNGEQYDKMFDHESDFIRSEGIADL